MPLMVRNYKAVGNRLYFKTYPVMSTVLYQCPVYRFSAGQESCYFLFLPVSWFYRVYSFSVRDQSLSFLSVAGPH